MRYTINIPDNIKDKDISEIYLLTPEEVSKFINLRAIDTNFSPITINPIIFNNPLDFNNNLIKYCLENSGNIAVYNKDNSLTILRGQELKRAGTEYPGIGVGIIIPDENNNIAMTLRSGMANNRIGFWDLPGGTVELKDTLEKTVVKEAFQETGLIVEPISCIGIYQDMDFQHWLSLTYVAKIINGKLQNMEPYKFEKVEFKNFNYLPDNTSILTRKSIDRYRDYLLHGKTIDILK